MMSYANSNNLDTFQKAVCLMTAITKDYFKFKGNYPLTKRTALVIQNGSLYSKNGDEIRTNSELSAELGLEAALKMCEKPLTYSNKECTIKFNLDFFEYQIFKEKYPDEWHNKYQEIKLANFNCDGELNELVYKSLTLKYLYEFVNAKVNGQFREDSVDDRENNKILLKK